MYVSARAISISGLYYTNLEAIGKTRLTSKVGQERRSPEWRCDHRRAGGKHYPWGRQSSIQVGLHLHRERLSVLLVQRESLVERAVQS